jgi:acyl carrier protein
MSDRDRHLHAQGGCSSGRLAVQSHSAPFAALDYLNVERIETVDAKRFDHRLLRGEARRETLERSGLGFAVGNLARVEELRREGGIPLEPFTQPRGLHDVDANERGIHVRHDAGSLEEPTDLSGNPIHCWKLRQKERVMMVTVSAAPPRTSQWTEVRITDLVLDLLADLLKQDRESLQRELLEKGATMPVDSLDLMDVLVEFRQRTGLKIPKKKLRRRDMQSVQAFASFVAREAAP